MTATALSPASSDGNALGTAALEWSDLYLADGALIYFGDAQDTTLTHADGSGLTLNSTNKLMFNDASQFVQGSSATVLSIGATDEIDLTATAIDINGTVDISGTLTQGGASQFNSTITVGANDQGYDVILYGDTASANVTWDTSVDDLILNGAARIVIPDSQLVLGSTAVTSTAAEINLIDGGTARGTDALASGDGILINDAGTMKMTNVDTVKTFMQSGLSSFDPDGAVVFNDSSADVDFRIESNGNADRFFVNGGDNTVLFGTQTSQAIADTFAVQIFGTTQSEAGLAITRNSNNNGYPNLVFGKSRNTTPGSFTIVQDNDYLGEIHWHADDGTDMATIGAAIRARVDGTPGANDMPTELIFATTPDGAADTTDILRIRADGRAEGQWVARSWMNLNMNGSAIRSSFNHDTITDIGTGQFACSFTVNQPSGTANNYIVVEGTEQPHSGGHSNLAEDSYRMFAYNSSASAQDVTYSTSATFVTGFN